MFWGSDELKAVRKTMWTTFVTVVTKCPEAVMPHLQPGRLLLGHIASVRRWGAWHKQGTFMVSRELRKQGGREGGASEVRTPLVPASIIG